MDGIDRKICGLLQANGRASSAELAEAVGLSVSSANERVRRLVAQGVITGWQAVLDRAAAGASLCAFVLLDVDYEGEAETCASLRQRPEVMELHHISGARSYIMKVRLADTAALQGFLKEVVKPLRGVRRTETMISLEALKETMAVPVAQDDGRRP